MPGALQRYRIVELGDSPAVAVLGMLLADQGAEVIKVEAPTGDPLRGTPVFAVWNRGKRSVTAEALRRVDLDRLERLIRASDIVVEGFGTSRNPYGIDAKNARLLREDIIYVSIPGVGDNHGSTELLADELIVSAATAVYGDRSPDRTEGVSFIALPYASIFGAMVAAAAITAALFHRERTGVGQDVSVPLYDAMFTAMGSAAVKRTEIPAPPRSLSPAIGRFYQCADGRWINLNATYERSLKPLLNAMGHSDWYGLLTDERLAENAEELEEWVARFREPWLGRTALEWEDLMGEAGVPLTMCRTLQEWMETEHAEESGMVVELDDPVFGRMRQVGLQVELSDTPGAVPGAAPGLGQHNDALQKIEEV